MLLISLWISLFCVGLRIISSKGMILHFLRGPYELLKDKHKTKAAILMQLRFQMEQAKKAFDLAFLQVGKGVTNEGIQELMNQLTNKQEEFENYRADNKNFLMYAKIGIYLLKPIIGCGTCMASVWTVVWFLVMEITFDYKFFLIAFMTAAMNALIYATYEMIERIGK